MSAPQDPRSAAKPSAPTSGDERLLLLRYSGDISTKAPPTRKRFVKRLVRNVKDALKSGGLAFEVVRTHDRIFVRTKDPQAPAMLSRVFGIQSLAVAEEREWQSIDDLVAAGVALFADAVAGRSFAVRARRVGERREIPTSSEEVQRALGAALLPHAKKVDLSHPDVTVSLEIMRGRVYFFRDPLRAEGGLPLGCEDSAVALVSGGFDSAVAAWQLMRRGVELDYVFCNLGGRDHQLETIRVMKIIADQWSYGTRPHFHAIDFDDVTRELQAKVEMRLWQIVLKRLMMRAAEAVARERDGMAIVTGEAVGQVSSQTLPNLAVISRATELPILRPLVGLNKDEIIGQSRLIGTHDLSSQVGEYCALVPSKPATRSTLSQIEAEESKLDFSVLERAIAEKSIFDLRRLDVDSFERIDLQTDRVPEGATVIDLRSKTAWQGWHYPEALHLDFQRAMALYREFDVQQRYVLYCEFGLKSAHLAELMQREGYDATHFGRGLKALLAYAREQRIETPEL
jgi:thiamine biosynthesis protein ThiI